MQTSIFDSLPENDPARIEWEKDKAKSPRRNATPPAARRSSPLAAKTSESPAKPEPDPASETSLVAAEGRGVGVVESASSGPSATKPAKSAAAQSRAERNQTAREELLRYYERKKIALGKEKKNYSKLIFILGNGKDKWFKAFGHSAVIFEHRVAPLIGSKAVARQDGDHNRSVHSKEGVVSYQYIDALIQKLKKINCTLEDDRNDIYIFNLPWRVTEEEYNLYLRESQEAVERTNKILAPHLVDSVLYTRMILLHRLVANSVGRMSANAREMVGLTLEQETRMMIRKYLKTARRGTDPMKMYEEILSLVDDTKGDLAAITGLNFDSDSKILELADKTEDVRKETLLRMKIYKAEQINKEQGDNPK